jgi:CRP/FNR family transcriptional regulator, cyclic AMP receptor protein
MSVPNPAAAITSSPRPSPELVFVSGSDQRKIVVDHVPFTVGRKPDRDLTIADTRVSRDHAVIEREGGDFLVVDAGSAGGTFVNGEKIDRRKLNSNDRVEFGAKGGPYFVFSPTGSEHVERATEVSAIARVSVFSKLSQPDIEELTKIVKAKKYASDKAVFFQGDPSDSLYIVVKGSVKVAKASDDGHEKILDILGTGEIFGELAMLDGHPRSATVTTCEPTELAAISRSDFRDYVSTHADIIWKVLESLCERVRKTSTDMLELSSREVPYRLLAALSQLAEKHGQVAADGSCLISGSFAGINGLVAMVGSSKDVVSRLLHRYQEEGLIELGNNKLIIPDPKVLARALEYSSQWS